MKDLVILTGPTASGKSEVCEIVSSKVACRIINCDSKQIYSDVPIITDQPPLTSCGRYRLYGYVAPSKNYSAGLWLEDAKAEIQDSWQQGILPIVIGGSGLYINSLIRGLSDIPPIDKQVRERAKELLSTMGKDAFYEMLVTMDTNAKRLHKNNTHQVLRAFEVMEQTGVSIFVWHKQSARAVPFKNYKIFVLMPPREELYNKINARFLHMMHSAAVAEVQLLMSMNLPDHLPVMKAHGVPEIKKYLSGEMSLDEAVETAQRNTRHYAKRQCTWFRTQLPALASSFNDKHQLSQHIIGLYT